MVKTILALTILPALLGGFATAAHASPGARPAAPFDYAPWARVLEQFVNENGLVDYGRLKAERGDLERFVAAVAERSPESSPQEFPTQPSQLAYWINAYNALVIQGVVESWPVKSVRDIGMLPFSFFWKKKFKVGGREMTLNDIEGVLRKKDPRIHFAIVCASHGCPVLSREAYVPDRVEQQLDQAARRFINDSSKVRIDAAQDRVWLSSIFKWYRDDFEGYARSHGLKPDRNLVLAYIRQYASPENVRALDTLRNPKIDYLDYDWGINALYSPS